MEGRPTGVFHRAVPGGYFPLPDGSPSEVGNLHLGFSAVQNMRPHPDPAGTEPRAMSQSGRAMRLWVLVGDNDSEDAILERSRALAAATPHGEFVELPGRHHFNAPGSRDFRRAALEFFGTTV